MAIKVHAIISRITFISDSLTQHNVLYVLDFKVNLISIAKLINQIKKIIDSTKLIGGLYMIQFSRYTPCNNL
ncbi:hypothetical protein CR513_33383, partial [Mucuna pruriens]